MSTKWDGHYLDLWQAVRLIPIWQEACWLEKNLVNGGALHIILEDGNCATDNIEYCIKYIESGKYAKDFEDWEGEVALAPRQLAFAKSLLDLTAFEVGFVITGNGLTEELFDHLYNNEITPVNIA